MKRNKILLSAMALAIATPAIVVPMNADAATYAKTFKDVSKNNAYYDIIHTMAQKGIISGYEDGTFKPSQNISRKHAAALISRAVTDLEKTTAFKAPKDLSTKNPYYNDIKKLMEAGMLELDSKGNINPNAPLTRGEMAKILTIAYNLDTTGSHKLSDVSSDVNKYVVALFNADVTTGFEDSTFRENESLTRAHYAVFMSRAAEFLDERLTLDDLKNMTKEEAAKITNEQLLQVVEPFKYVRGATIPENLKNTNLDALLEKNKAEFNKKAVEIKANIFVNTAFSNNPLYYYNLSNMLNGWTVGYDVSMFELVTVLNKVFLEGVVVRLGDNENAQANIVMYYDYRKGDLVYAAAPKE